MHPEFLSAVSRCFCLFIYWLCCVFIAVQAFSTCGEWGLSSLWGLGFSLQWLLLFWSTDCRLMSFSTCGFRLSSYGLVAYNMWIFLD